MLGLVAEPKFGEKSLSPLAARWTLEQETKGIVGKGRDTGLKGRRKRVSLEAYVR